MRSQNVYKTIHSALISLSISCINSPTGMKYNVDNQLLKKLPVGTKGNKLIKIITKQLAKVMFSFFF